MLAADAECWMRVQWVVGDGQQNESTPSGQQSQDVVQVWWRDRCFSGSNDDQPRVVRGLISW